MKLIDKDTVLAEIKELSSAIKIQLDYKKGDAFWIAQKLLLERLERKINSLKVIEVVKITQDDIKISINNKEQKRENV